MGLSSRKCDIGGIRIISTAMSYNVTIQTLNIIYPQYVASFCFLCLVFILLRNILIDIKQVLSSDHGDFYRAIAGGKSASNQIEFMKKYGSSSPSSSKINDPNEDVLEDNITHHNSS